jgi:hypothetical protein
MLLGVAYLREIAERQVWGCSHDREETDVDDCGRKRAEMPAPRSESVAGHIRPRPEALGWQKIANDWRERARAETFVRLSACLHEVRKSLSSHSHNSCKTMAQEFEPQTKTNMCRDSVVQRYMGRERAYETDVRARRAPPSSTPLWQRLNVIMTKWRGLIQIARNPYRPELHYMRGPGPKSYAKHQGRTENGPL